MRYLRARQRSWTRRAFLGGLGVSALAGEVFPADWKRFPDPATEFEVFRLTDPSYSSHLPAYFERAISRRGTFLLFWSDRTGSPQAFRMDLKTGETRQITQAEALDGSTITLLRDERSVCFFDGPSLQRLDLGKLHEREIYRAQERTPGASVTGDGQSAIFGELRGSGSRLKMVSLIKGTDSTVAEAPWTISDPVARPRRAQILYRQGAEALWLVNLDGQQNRKLKLAPGRIGPALWSPDGKTILYLHYPEEKTKLNAIREHTPDENLDKLVAPTSQYMHFGCNGDTSVFVGASRNKASPHVLILLRISRRELTLCEHRASDPATVAPVFSPDSQRVFFQSDQHGKPALYSVRVEKFVEKIDSET